MLIPSIKISPLVASKNPSNKYTIILFPLPVDPIMPKLSPEFRTKLILSKTVLSFIFKLTFLNSIFLENETSLIP